MMLQITLLSNASATGSAVKWPGGRGVFNVVATFSGGTVKLQYLGADGSTYVDYGAATTLTAAGSGVFELPAGTLIKANVATSTAVYASVAQVQRND